MDNKHEHALGAGDDTAGVDPDPHPNDNCVVQGDCNDTRELLDIITRKPSDACESGRATPGEGNASEAVRPGQVGPAPEAEPLSLAAAASAGHAASAGGAPHPGWGRAVTGQPGRDSRGTPPPGGLGGLPGGGNVPPGGAWVWLPQGVEQKKPWRKRHPILFWGGVILLLVMVFGWGRMSGEDSPMGGPKIAVVNVDDIILDADSIVAWMEKVRKDTSYKGAIIRINSPGGAVGPSQEIYAAVKRLASSKPVVASMGSLAASGGYYAALGADTILAGPSTLTASIGVKMQVPNIGELMHTIGISEKTLTTGTLKDAGSTWREMTPEEEAYLQELLTDMYEEFIETVARERDLPLDKVRGLADGRAMTGRQALSVGLVDALGDKQEALRMVKSRADLGGKEARLVEGPEKPGSYISELLRSTLDVLLERKASVSQPVFLY